MVDRLDECPDIPGPADNKGCPTKGGAKSFPQLDNIAKVILAHPELEKIRVEGHTDNQGNPSYNTDLSQRRAASVVSYLVDHGVAAERLAAQGFGPDRPIADNETPEGRAKNRRVEFHIVSGESDAAPVVSELTASE